MAEVILGELSSSICTVDGYVPLCSFCEEALRQAAAWCTALGSPTGP